MDQSKWGGSVSKARICTYSDVSDRIDYLLWGDSHAMMLDKQLSQNLMQYGKNGIMASIPACPPLTGIYTSKRKNRILCRDLSKYVVRLVQEEQIPIVVMAGRWANLASNYRAPGDGEPSMKLFDAEHGNTVIDFEKALHRTIEQLNAAGANVVIVGPVPEIDFDVPNMLIRSAQLGRRLPSSDRNVFDLRQEIVLPTLNRMENLPSVSAVYPHEVLCDDRYCRISKGQIPLYRDDDHLNRTGIKLILPSIVKSILSNDR